MVGSKDTAVFARDSEPGRAKRCRKRGSLMAPLSPKPQTLKQRSVQNGLTRTDHTPEVEGTHNAVTSCAALTWAPQGSFNGGLMALNSGHFGVY